MLAMPPVLPVTSSSLVPLEPPATSTAHLAKLPRRGRRHTGKLSLRALLLGLGCSLGLSACTGTLESPPPLKVVVLSEKGSKLGYVQTDADVIKLENVADLTDAVSLFTTDNGNKITIIGKAGVQQRDNLLGNSKAFDKLPFETCLSQGSLSADRSKLLVLSQCDNTTQNLALYSLDGRVIWTAKLPVVTTLSESQNLPPTRIAMLGSVAIVSRAALNGGSEVIRVVQNRPTDNTAAVGNPQESKAIYDLLTIDSSTVYAATQSGVRSLLPSGLPNTAQVVNNLTAKYERIWSSVGINTRMLAFWDSNTNKIQVMDRLANPPTLKTAGFSYANTQDITFSNDGFMYFVTNNSLYRLDTTLFFVNTGNSTPALVLSNLKEASSLAWVLDR